MKMCTIIRCIKHIRNSASTLLSRCDLGVSSSKYIKKTLLITGLNFRSHNNHTLTSNEGSNDRKKIDIQNGPGLKEFIQSDTNSQIDHEFQSEASPYLSSYDLQGWNRKVYFEVYGCQMNVNDTEIVWSILKSAGFERTHSASNADVILMVTCAIREGAESKVWNKLFYYKSLKLKNKIKSDVKIGILGCMAERLKHTLLDKEKAVDLVAGPDSYKDLPRLLALTSNNQVAVNVMLSLDETYADITPVRLNQDSVTAYVSIMRGCDNMCSYCIVPFTRGRERSRPTDSIIRDVQQLSENGVKEITLLGQNVNSYRDTSTTFHSGVDETHLVKGFKTVYKAKKGGLRFADLLDKVSSVDPNMRIRFTSPHPKDFPDEVLQIISERNNICNSLHLPTQSGNSAVLERMRRGYTREAYLELIRHVRELLPGVTISSDFICGFCGETDEEFEDTLSLMEEVKYNVAFLFPYSMREKTTAHRRYNDDVPGAVKQERLLKMVSTFRKHAELLNKAFIGTTQLILVEGRSKRSYEDLYGRIDGNIKVIIPKTVLPFEESDSSELTKPGDYVVVKINAANCQVLKGTPLCRTTLDNFYDENKHTLIQANR